MKRLGGCSCSSWVLGLLLQFVYHQLLSVRAVGQTASALKTEYCEWETFNATCPDPDQVVVIRSARYGRMKIGDCITSNYGHIGCAADVTSDFERVCSGRRRCQIGVITLHDRRSCPKDFKSYLEAHYDCVRVDIPDILSADNGVSPDDDDIEPATISPAVTSPKHGLVSSAIWRETVQREAASSSSSSDATVDHNHRRRGPASALIDRPFTVCVAPYQRVNVTVVDFSVEHGGNGGSSNAAISDALSFHDLRGGGSKRFQMANPPRVLLDVPVSSLSTISCSSPLATVTDYQLFDRKLNESSSAATAMAPSTSSSSASSTSQPTATICGGQSRTSAAYISATNCVQIWINISAPVMAEFFVRYEAFGCPPIVPPPGGWTRYDSLRTDRQIDDNQLQRQRAEVATPLGPETVVAAKTAVVRCNESGESWHLLCRGTDWIGTVGNCSEDFISSDWNMDEVWSLERLFATAANFPFGIAVVLSLGVALGVTIGAIMLAAVIALMRRRHRRQAQKLRLKPDGGLQIGPETTPTGSTRAFDKTWKTAAAEMFTRGRKSRRGVTGSLQHYRKPDTVSAVSAGSRGGPNAGVSSGTAVSWQRLRPLPIPTQTDENPVDGGTVRKSSSVSRHNVLPVTSDSRQPLLSPISPISPMSLDVTQMRTVSYGVRERENAFPFVAVSNRRRQIEAVDAPTSSSSAASPFCRGPSVAWLPAPQRAPPPLPQPRLPIGGSTGESASSGGTDAGSPYYFTLDPALTQHRRFRMGYDRSPTDRTHLPSHSQHGQLNHEHQSSNQNGCFMCDSGVMTSSR